MVLGYATAFLVCMGRFTCDLIGSPEPLPFVLTSSGAFAISLTTGLFGEVNFPDNSYLIGDR